MLGGGLACGVIQCRTATGVRLCTYTFIILPKLKYCSGALRFHRPKTLSSVFSQVTFLPYCPFDTIRLCAFFKAEPQCVARVSMSSIINVGLGKGEGRPQLQLSGQAGEEVITPSIKGNHEKLSVLTLLKGFE